MSLNCGIAGLPNVDKMMFSMFLPKLASPAKSIPEPAYWLNHFQEIVECQRLNKDGPTGSITVQRCLFLRHSVSCMVRQIK